MISTKQATFAEVDEAGRLILPPEVAQQYGLRPGAKVRIDQSDNVVRLHRPTSQLTHLYVEPTDHSPPRHQAPLAAVARTSWVTSISGVW
jgi:hypothetical protein